MNGRLEAARLWWSARTGREQVLLAVMTAALVGVLGWYGVVTPLMAASDAAQARVEKASIQWGALRGLAAGANRSTASGGATPQAVVEAAASKVGLPIARHRQDANGRFTIWIAAIDSKILLPWTASLEREGGVKVTDFTASRLDNGLLEAEITFARAAP
ncbi:type II secretion system protein M [Caulobacter vibrioides]|uniref:Type II secretion system protein M n=1 Tax=Caulobacter vibrioides TaxID=155892 RepID=A0A290MMX6_CAUVI|nr:type II secretion system protein M [Caulobacter vibrioides]ATC33436.1 type II secretion system protein M [Caulobacter vibrioides]